MTGWEAQRPRLYVAEVRVYSAFGYERIDTIAYSRWLWVAWFWARLWAWFVDLGIPECGEIGIDWRVRDTTVTSSAVASPPVAP